MGLLRNLIENMKEMDKRRDEIDDEQTTDRYLRSLRRQRRTQLEELEKEQLMKDIKGHEKMRTKEAVLGIPLESGNAIKKNTIRKRIALLKQKQYMIGGKKKKKSFFSKGNI